MYEPQHRTALVAERDPATDDIQFSILEVAGKFCGQYLLVEGNDLKTIEEIDSPATNRALRLLWENERIAGDHLEQLKTDLFYRTVSLA